MWFIYTNNLLWMDWAGLCFFAWLCMEYIPIDAMHVEFRQPTYHTNISRYALCHAWQIILQCTYGWLLFKLGPFQVYQVNTRLRELNFAVDDCMFSLLSKSQSGVGLLLLQEVTLKGNPVFTACLDNSGVILYLLQDYLETV